MSIDIVPAPRAWSWKDAPRTPSIFDPGSRDNQFDRYTAATLKPTWRNKGPRGRVDCNLTCKKFAAACDFSIPAGAVYRGQTLPQGAILKCKAVSRFAPSRRQGMVLLRKARRQFPGAYLALWQHLKGYADSLGEGPGRLILPAEQG